MSVMGSPYKAGRDSFSGSGNAFDEEADVADEHLGAFQESFRPGSDNLSEEDYRDPADHGGPVPNLEMAPTLDREPTRFTYPFERGPGGALAD